MKKSMKSICFFIALLSLTKNGQAQYISLDIRDSLSKEPIENVYVYDSMGKFLCFSDNFGRCTFNTNQQENENREIRISHVGYLPKTIVDSYKTTELPIFLKQKIFELSDVVITPSKLNAREIVVKAIQRIDSNYVSYSLDTLDLKVRISFLDKMLKNSLLLDFQGDISICKQKKWLAIKQNTIIHELGKTFSEYENTLSPTDFFAIISPKSFPFIRKLDEITLKLDEIINYHGEEVYKIFIQSTKHKNDCNGIEGYLLIHTKDYGIVDINYTVGACKPLLIALDGLKLISTNLDYYKVSAQYEKSSNGNKYDFFSGSINYLFNRTIKKKIISDNTYNVNMERINQIKRTNFNYTGIRSLFKKK